MKIQIYLHFIYSVLSVCVYPCIHSAGEIWASRNGYGCNIHFHHSLLEVNQTNNRVFKMKMGGGCAPMVSPPPGNTPLPLQGDQLYIAVFLWYLVKRDFFSELYYTVYSVHNI